MPHLPFSRRIRSSARQGPSRAGRALAAAALTLVALPVAAQPAAAPADLTSRIASLSSLDYPTRMNAARQIRREPAAPAVAALRAAVAKHPDEFVRYRAFVLLSAFNDRATADVVPALLRDRNDRLREAAYKWLETHPDPAMTSTLLAALQTELAEFVRPALVAALAAVDDTPQVQRALIVEANRGVDFFRSAVIDALGRHRATYAADTIADVAKLEGPLQDDALLALGRIGGTRARSVLTEFAKAPPALLAIIHAARCLSGEPCEALIKAIADAAGSSTSLGTVRAAAGALSAIASDGKEMGTSTLVTLGERGGALRDEAALGLAAAAVRNPSHVIKWLETAPEAVRGPALELLKVGFEDLEEDFGKEQFYAAARASYWAAGEGSAGRTLAATIIQQLDF